MTVFVESLHVSKVAQCCPTVDPLLLQCFPTWAGPRTGQPLGVTWFDFPEVPLQVHLKLVDPEKYLLHLQWSCSAHCAALHVTGPRVGVRRDAVLKSVSASLVSCDPGRTNCCGLNDLTDFYCSWAQGQPKPYSHSKMTQHFTNTIQYPLV